MKTHRSNSPFGFCLPARPALKNQRAISFLRSELIVNLQKKKKENLLNGNLSKIGDSKTSE